MKTILILLVAVSSCIRTDYKKEVSLCHQKVKGKTQYSPKIMTTEIENIPLNCKEKCYNMENAKKSNMAFCRQCAKLNLPFNGETLALILVSGQVSMTVSKGAWERYSYYCTFINGVMNNEPEFEKYKE